MRNASAGLIVTEATNVSPNSCAFEHAPGIWTEAQVDGWKIVTRAVHQNSGRIFMQLWHCGRVGASGILKGNDPLSPSGVNDDLDALQVYGLMANGNYVRIAATPSRAMTIDEIKTTVQEYKAGAIIVNAGISPDSAEALVSAGDADAVAFGRMFIANPNPPQRIRRNLPYTELRNIGLYGGDRTGYVDYPFLE